MPPEFEVHPEADDFLRLSGEFDLAALDEFLDVALAAVDGQREVVLDLSNVDFMDSSGIRAILKLAAKVNEKGVVLRNPKQNVRAVIRVAGVEGHLGIRVEPPEEDPPSRAA
jgi:anti-sigma B factor antagonist